MRSALAFMLLAGCGAATASPPNRSMPLATSEPPPKITVGARAPAFERRAIPTGAPVAIRPGEVTILVFWATWSAPDKQELLALNRSQRRVIALSLDDEPDGLAEYVKTYGLRFEVAWDKDREVAERYGLRTAPTTYVIDGQGIIRFIHDGYRDAEDRAIMREADALSRGTAGDAAGGGGDR